MVQTEPIKQFQQYIEIQCYSQATKKAYQFHIQKFLDYYRNPRQQNIITHLLYLKNKGYGASSLTIARSALVYYFKRILKQQITIDIPKPKRPRILPKPISRENVFKLIQVTTNLKHRTLIELIYSSGIRLSETHRLRWDDLDYINHSIRINKGKGGKDRISILSDEVIKHLIDLQEIAPKNNPYIFFSNARPNNHISKKTIQKVLENSSEKAELGFKATPHQLRHSFATHLIENGYDISYVKDLLGHSSIKTTQGYNLVTNKNLLRVKSPLDSLVKTQNENVKSNKNYTQKVVKTKGSV